MPSVRTQSSPSRSRLRAPAKHQLVPAQPDGALLDVEAENPMYDFKMDPATHYDAAIYDRVCARANVPVWEALGEE